MSSTPEHFDTVVVGSGFGGSVTAYRLVEDGLRVCLLDRGKAHPPGSFARTPYDTENGSAPAPDRNRAKPAIR